MDAEHLALAVLGALWAVLGLLYGGVLWEIRKLREARHRQANQIHWCMIAIGLLTKKQGIELQMPGDDE